ncbi:MAG: YcxB family protein [Pseudomonadota bacterium]
MREARYTLTERDAVDATKLFYRRQMFGRSKPMVFLIVVIIAAVTVLVGLGEADRVLDNSLLQILISVIILVVIVIAIFYLFFVAPMARKNYRQTKLLHGEVEISWTPEAITFAGDWGSTIIAWGDYHKWAENERLFVLFQSDALFNILRKDALGPEASLEIRQLLERASVKKA